MPAPYPYALIIGKHDHQGTKQMVFEAMMDEIPLAQRNNKQSRADCYTGLLPTLIGKLGVVAWQLDGARMKAADVMEDTGLIAAVGFIHIMAVVYGESVYDCIASPDPIVDCTTPLELKKWDFFGAHSEFLHRHPHVEDPIDQCEKDLLAEFGKIKDIVIALYAEGITAPEIWYEKRFVAAHVNVGTLAFLYAIFHV